MVVFHYSTSRFIRVGLDQTNAAFATCGVWCTYLVFALVSIFLIDRAGRKMLLVISQTGIVIGLGLLILFMVLSGTYRMDWAKHGCAASMFFYTAYAIASGSVPFFLPNEIFRQNSRTAGMTLIAVLMPVFGLITSLLFPIFVFSLEEYTSLIFVASVAVASVITTWKLPETKGKSVDEIQLLLHRSK